MKLNNPHHTVFVVADKKFFKVLSVAKDDKEANMLLELLPQGAVIDTDEMGNVFIAEVKPTEDPFDRP